jgi:hypothetical protein
MYNYYEDEPYYNPEDFLEEYETEIRDIILNAVNKKIKETIDGLTLEKSKNEVLTKEVGELKSKIRSSERIYKEELDKALKEKEIETTRRLTFELAPHDTVYYVKSKSTDHKCEKCNGKGKVKIEVLGKNTEVSCPHCSYGSNTTHFYYPEKDTITTVAFNIYRKDRNNKNSGSEMSEGKIWLEHYDYEKKVSDLFKTLEECQQKCDELNNKQSK